MALGRWALGCHWVRRTLARAGWAHWATTSTYLGRVTRGKSMCVVLMYPVLGSTPTKPRGDLGWRCPLAPNHTRHQPHKNRPSHRAPVWPCTGYMDGALASCVDVASLPRNLAGLGASAIMQPDSTALRKLGPFLRARKQATKISLTLSVFFSA